MKRGDRFTGNLPYSHYYLILGIGKFAGTRKKAIVLEEHSSNFPNVVVYDMAQFKKKKLKPWTQQQWKEYLTNSATGNP